MNTAATEPSYLAVRSHRLLFRRLVSIFCGALVGTTLLAGEAGATPSKDVLPSPLGSGTLSEPLRLKLKDGETGFGDGIAVRQVVTIKYTVQPGGYFGWHRHGGPVWVVVAAGTLTLYDADDTTCTARPQPVGSAFLDSGDHVHNARNEGSETVVVYATFLLPAGGLARIDAPDPMTCSF